MHAVTEGDLKRDAVIVRFQRDDAWHGAPLSLAGLPGRSDDSGLYRPTRYDRGGFMAAAPVSLQPKDRIVPVASPEARPWRRARLHPDRLRQRNRPAGTCRRSLPACRTPLLR